MTTLLLPDLIRTMNPARPTAEGVVIDGPRVVDVGGAAELRARHPGANEHHLTGVLLPAFIDPHHHFCLAAFDRRAPRITLAAGASVAEVQRQVADLYRGSTPGAGWLRAQGYNPVQLAERRAPTRWELDEVCPDRPLLVSAYSLHEGVLNSAGLAAMGWNRRTPNPPKGVLRRNRRGELTGEVAEACYFLAEAASRGALLEDARDAWICEAQRHGEELLAYGITRVGDAAVPPEFDELYLRAAEAGMLPVTVHRLHVGAGSLLEARSAPQVTGAGPADTPAGPAKLFLDGAERCHLCLHPGQVVGMARLLTRRALGGGGLAALRSAARIGPARLRGGQVHVGAPFVSPRELRRTVAGLHDHGFQVAFHALGNGAVALACDELASGPHDLGADPPRIEHLCFTDRELARRVADSGAVAVVQPAWVNELGDDFIHHGIPRGLDVIALRSLIDAGAAVSGSSDYPVAGFDVLRAVSAAATRTTAGGRVLHAHQAVTVEQALELYTTGAAHALGVADRAGRVTPGFDADFVVLGGDPLRTDPAAVAHLPVRETWRRGERVFAAAPDSSSTGAAS